MCDANHGESVQPTGNRPSIIAVCGKGGAGKTSISAAIVRTLLEDPARRVLAIDADPAVGLASALGVEVTRTVDDIRTDLIGKMESAKGSSRTELLSNLDYEVFEAISERGNLAFLAIGRPEREGCYCQVNDLLRDIIAGLAENFDAVVIDGEAGIEQVNRRVMEHVTHLLTVSDLSARGINVVKSIRKVASSAVHYETTGLILNRIRREEELRDIIIPDELSFLGWIPEDEAVRNADIHGRSLLDLPSSALHHAVRDCLCRAGVVGAYVQARPHEDGHAHFHAHDDRPA